ncbi:hypothetical protein E2C01_060558 [Portunus trituberculatus]|uniref:Uncharacterized protein n=1 Tax=Portunus trituberculatus TaxID=210409 RepID=A0A5B7H1I0_PORTR|nr:hypothetical protein [Portunus trituberculatus]
MLSNPPPLLRKSGFTSHILVFKLFTDVNMKTAAGVSGRDRLELIDSRIEPISGDLAMLVVDCWAE